MHNLRRLRAALVAWYGRRRRLGLPVPRLPRARPVGVGGWRGVVERGAPRAPAHAPRTDKYIERDFEKQNPKKRKKTTTE